MAEFYRISATPTVYLDGEFKGKLRGVTFTAISADDRVEWYTRNCGQFEKEFARIMASDLANDLHRALLCGEEVQFPGRYTESQFERGFMFEWSPVYFVAPPAFAF